MCDTPKIQSDSFLSVSQITEAPSHILPKKISRLSQQGDEETSNVSKSKPIEHSTNYCPATMQLVSVLQNDTRSKSITLHTRFSHNPDKDAIVLLQKSPFPNDADTLCSLKVAQGKFLTHSDCSSSKDINENAFVVANGADQFPKWEAKPLLDNDVYYRFLVSAGLELVNDINMTVIHPAEAHHFQRYTISQRCLVNETPEMYTKRTLPFLAVKPRDLAWVDNILAGSAEQDRILLNNPDASSGFTLVLDYRWDGKRLHELHCLGLVRDPSLTCLRDLNASHIPMLKRILAEGRKTLTERYTTGVVDGPSLAQEQSSTLTEDQVLAYLHYPPTFYRLHVHFIHIDASDDAGTRTGRAHLLEEVIRNLEMASNYYANRTLSIYLHNNSPMLAALRAQESPEELDCSLKDQ